MAVDRAAAEAFSGHRFAEAYDRLADDVAWVVPGMTTLHGRQSVIDACTETATGLTGTGTEFVRFLVVEGDDAVAVDAVARYTAADGSVSAVSSADLYEFRDGRIALITSYAVEVDPADPGRPAAGPG